MNASPMHSNRQARTRLEQSCVSRRFHPYDGRHTNSSGLDRASSLTAPHIQHFQNPAGSPVNPRLPNNALNGFTNDPPTSVQRITRCPYSAHNDVPSLRMYQRNNCQCPHMRRQHHFLPPIVRRDYFYSHQIRSTPPLPRHVHISQGRAIYRSPNSSAARRNSAPVIETVPTIEMRPVTNKTSAQGTRSFPFQPTPGEDGDALQSITAMRVYRDKSVEELRLEDYRRGNKGKMKDKVEVQGKDIVHEEDDQEKQKQNCCVICLENRKSVLILPCSHMCICAECSDNKSLEKCPICRSSIEGKLIVYW